MLLAPTDDIMFFANGEHEEHEIFFFSQQICFCQRRTRRTRSFFFSQQICFCQRRTRRTRKFLFGQQITQITQKINFVRFVLSVGKRKKIRVICVICWQKSPAILTDNRAWQKLNSQLIIHLNHYMLFVLLLLTCRSRTCRWPSTARSWLRSQSPCPHYRTAWWWFYYSLGRDARYGYCC